MPTINISGAAPEASKPTSKIDAYNRSAAPNYLQGSEKDIRNSTRSVLRSQSKWNALYERAERDDWNWDRQAELKRRRQFDRELLTEQRDTQKWHRLHDQAERQNFRFDQTQRHKVESTISRFNNNLIRRYSQVEAKLNPTTGMSSGGLGRGSMSGRRGGIGGQIAGRLFGHAGRSVGRAFGLEGLGGFGGDLELGALGGPVGIAAGIAAAAGAAVYEAPGWYSSILGSKIQGAGDYWNMQHSAARMARAGGGAYSAGSYVNRFYTGGKPTSLESKYGYGPGDLYGMARDAGLPPLSPGQLQGFGASVGASKYSQYLGAVDPKQTAAMMGLFSTLPGFADQSKNWGKGNSTASGNMNVALRKWQGVLAIGVREGLNSATISRDLSSFITAASTSGGAGIGVGKAAGFIGAMTAGGLASMRDGSGIANAQQAATNFGNSAGAGGSPVATMALMNEVNRRGGLKKITSVAALGRLMGFDPKKLSPAERYEAQQAVAAAKAGDQFSFSTSLSPFIASNPKFAFQAASDWAKTTGLPSYRQSMLVSAMLGGSTSASSLGLNAAWQTRNSGPAMPKTTLGWSDINTREQDFIQKYARANGIDPRRLAATLEQESGFNANATNMSGGGQGAWGLGQIRAPALADLQAHGFEKGMTLKDMLDPRNATRASAEYLGMLTKRWGSPSAAAAHYYGSNSPSANAQYASVNDRLAAGFTGPTVSERNANRDRAVAAQAKTLRSGQVAGQVNALAQGPVGQVVQALDTQINGINSFGDALHKVTVALEEILRQRHLGGTPSQAGRLHFPGSGYNAAPGMVIYTHRPGPQQP